VEIDPQAAPVWRRVFAGAVDGSLMPGAWGVVIGAPVAWNALTGRGTADLTEELARHMKTLFGEREQPRRRPGGPNGWTRPPVSPGFCCATGPRRESGCSASAGRTRRLAAPRR
jgi:hypothetical protein